MVADFGCGDCKIARSVKNKVHSFDLAAACELVTVCDMANVSVSCYLLSNSPSVCVKITIKHTVSVCVCRSRSVTALWTSPCSASPSWGPTWQIF